VLDDDAIAEFQKNLNDAQPSGELETQTRSLIQYLYRKNPNNFCRFLVRSRLSHLILWTEAKCIVRHFGLRGVVYVKWNDDNSYECSLHRNIKLSSGGDLDHQSVQKTLENIGRSEFSDRSDSRDNKRVYHDNSNRKPYRDDRYSDRRFNRDTRYGDRDRRFNRDTRYGDRDRLFNRDTLDIEPIDKQVVDEPKKVVSYETTGTPNTLNEQTYSEVFQTT
jgi:hypothetical protein